MSKRIFNCKGGDIVLPNKELVLVSREDGGNLIVNPPREVWERSELSKDELTLWSFLVAATGQAMLEVLPQLTNGCINYWEAGNWALNDAAEPKGLRKTPREYRKVHLHLLGRNPASLNPLLKWGESPKFPDFVERFEWARNHERLTAEECLKILTRVKILLAKKFGLAEIESETLSICQDCRYPFSPENKTLSVICEECQK